MLPKNIVTEKYKTNDKPFLLMVEYPGNNRWDFDRLEKAEYFSYNLSSKKGWRRFAVVQDIRLAYLDFFDHRFTDAMRDAPDVEWTHAA
jgi:hypothetical protein